MTNTNTTSAELLRRLRDPDAGTRRRAVGDLGRLGEATPEVISGLVASFSDEVVEVRRAAPWVLSRFGPAAVGAIPDIVRLLRDEDPDVRSASAGALGRFGRAAVGAVRDLIPLLVDEDRFVRMQAVSALGDLGSADAIPALLSVMQGQGPGEGFAVLGDAVEALRKIGPGPESIPALLTILQHGDGVAIENAASLLAGIEGADAQAVPVLVERLGCAPDPRLQIDVNRGLGRFPSAIETVLIPRLRDLDPDVRAFAALGVGASDKAGVQAIPDLIRLLEDPVLDVRVCATMALSALPCSREKAAAAPRLTVMLRDEENKQLRSDVAEALASMGSDAEAVVPDLVELLRHPADWVRWEAAYVLARVGGPPREAIPLLIDLLREDSHAAQSHAAQALGCCGEAAADAVPDLLRLLHAEEEALRIMIAETLGEIGPAAAAAAPELVNLIRLHRPDGYFSTLAAIRAVGRIGPKAALAVPELLPLLESDDPLFHHAGSMSTIELGSVLKRLGWRGEEDPTGLAS